MAIIEQPAVSALDLDELQDFLRDNWDPDLTGGGTGSGWRDGALRCSRPTRTAGR
jgi:hypothetical protein